MTNLDIGLTSTQVKEQIKKFGFNEIEDQNLYRAIRNFLKILLDPMGFMLLVLSGVYWILKDRQNSLILLFAYIPIAAIDVVLELRTKSALRTLKKTFKATCQVLRDCKVQSIPIKGLVPADLLVLEEGQTLPADGIIISASNLVMDESSLTGESLPIEKEVGHEALAGTSILSGVGIVEITKTGLSSQIGSVATVLKEFESAPSPLLRLIQKIVKVVFLIALGFGVLVFFEGLLKNRSISLSLIAALTLAMAAVPEEFPLVFTLYLSMAAYRLSKKGVLVKSLPAVEGLGSVDVICTDKTGTLTEGKFCLQKTISSSQSKFTNSDVQSLVFSCEVKAVDAIEKSIFEWVQEEGKSNFIHDLQEKWHLKYDYPFDAKEKYMSHVWQNHTNSEQIIAMKGAIEGVLKHCDISEQETTVIHDLASREAGAGKRLLGLASRSGSFSGNRSDDEAGLKFIGILSFADPIRAGAKEAIRMCIDQDIQVKMLTGDHLLTAHYIADQINLPHNHDQLFSGPDLEKLSKHDRTISFQKGIIFARLKPTQKLELIQALKSEGLIVAMTGDGINDAPALKIADIGISMGEGATDVARSTAQIVLLKNDFSGIVSSMIEGRRVLESLRQSFGYLIAFHIPIVGLALFQSFFLDLPILLPIHIVLMEIIVHPVSALVFDEPTKGVFAKYKSFLNSKIIMWSIARGLLLIGLVIAAFFLTPGAYEMRRTLCVLLLVVGNLGLLIAESGGFFAVITRKSQSNRIWIATILLISLAFALSYVPIATVIFALTKPSILDFIILTVSGVSLGFICIQEQQRLRSGMKSMRN